MSKKNSRLVYSTDRARVCPNASQPDKQMKDKPGTGGDQVIKIRREKKGRAGKTVTTVFGIARSDLKPTAAAIKQQCGTGGSVKDGVIIIQGDHRPAVKSFLEKRGYTVKLAGG